jgi:hypothetical protein
MITRLVRSDICVAEKSNTCEIDNTFFLPAVLDKHKLEWISRKSRMQENVLNRLGFKRMINAAGHYTVLGGSQPDIRVSEEMQKASQYWIYMN